VKAVDMKSLVRCLQSLVSFQSIHRQLNHKLFVQCRDNYLFNERVVHKFLVEKKTEKNPFMVCLFKMRTQSLQT
jgi:hypothetical protein